jgi:hypothetical protein
MLCHPQRHQCIYDDATLCGCQRAPGQMSFQNWICWPKGQPQPPVNDDFIGSGGSGGQRQDVDCGTHNPNSVPAYVCSQRSQSAVDGGVLCQIGQQFDSDAGSCINCTDSAPAHVLGCETVPAEYDRTTHLITLDLGSSTVAVAWASYFVVYPSPPEYAGASKDPACAGYTTVGSTDCAVVNGTNISIDLSGEMFNGPLPFTPAAIAIMMSAGDHCGRGIYIDSLWRVFRPAGDSDTNWISTCQQEPF